MSSRRKGIYDQVAYILAHTLSVEEFNALAEAERTDEVAGLYWALREVQNSVVTVPGRVVEVVSEQKATVPCKAEGCGWHVFPSDTVCPGGHHQNPGLTE